MWLVRLTKNNNWVDTTEKFACNNSIMGDRFGGKNMYRAVYISALKD
jgi:hypothetical protein